MNADENAARQPDEVEEILRLVAEGHMSPQEADAVLSELDSGSGSRRSAGRAAAERARQVRGRESFRHARIEVTERGRSVVNMRVPILPLDLGRHALTHVPGLSEDNVDHITEAIERGLTGRILEVQDEDGDGVRITVE
jgi:homogentisate 1,2-dioxygenase